MDSISGNLGYDNEWGYSARVEELIGRLAAFDGMTSDFYK